MHTIYSGSEPGPGTPLHDSFSINGDKPSTNLALLVTINTAQLILSMPGRTMSEVQPVTLIELQQQFHRSSAYLCTSSSRTRALPSAWSSNWGRYTSFQGSTPSTNLLLKSLEDLVMTMDRTLFPSPAAYFDSQGLKLIGKPNAPWKYTQCQFHGGRRTMRVNMSSGGYICMSCGARGGDVLAYEIAITGASFVDAAKAIGAWVNDGRSYKLQKPTPLSARAALSAIAFECTFIAICAGNLAKGMTLSEQDYARLMTAAGRVNRVMELFA